MDGKVLIITSKSDTHPNSVINLMNSKAIEFFRLNTESFLVDYIFYWKYDDSSKDSIFYIKDKNNGSSIQSNEIISVWVRRPIPPDQLLYTVDMEVDRHNLEESKYFYLFLLYSISKKYYSIGNFFYDKYASSKIVQHELASKLGMKVPDTCFTNSKDFLLSFLHDNKDSILKPIFDYSVWYSPQNSYVFYTTKVNHDQLAPIEEESFQQTVNYSEKYISKKCEARITIIGSYIYSVIIESQRQKENEGQVDWRQGYDHGLKYHVFDLPLELEELCRRMLKEFNLNFGCFDFIITPDDEYVFLELNPNGQWGWIDEILNLKMSEALLDCLINRIPV